MLTLQKIEILKLIQLKALMPFSKLVNKKGQIVEESINEQNAQELLGKWIKENSIILFMKGTQDRPSCSYSKFAVELLKYYKVKNLKTVDVLDNELIRVQIKKFSKWPTIPQLFIENELIGGVDILKEMHKDGSLKKLLQEKKIII